MIQVLLRVERSCARLRQHQAVQGKYMPWHEVETISPHTGGYTNRFLLNETRPYSNMRPKSIAPRVFNITSPFT